MMGPAEDKHYPLAPCGPRHSGGTILVVEDDAVVCRTLGRLLQQEGYVVIAVAEGEQALDQVQSSPIDLVLLDLTLPDMDGLEVCERLRADPRTADIPIIVLTARDGREYGMKSRAAGASDCVPKPFDATTLLDHVDSYLSTHHRGGS